MASSTLFRLCVLVFMITSLVSSSVSDTPEKVKLDIYYESLSLDSADFIANDLLKIFFNGLIKFVDLNFVPSGHARLNKDNEDITCRHGEYECKLNMVEACAIQALSDMNRRTELISCIESAVVRKEHTDWEICYELLEIDPEPITNCTNSSLGKQLQLKYADETESLAPPLKFLPWIVVNNVPLREDYDKFMTYICKAYTGTPPEACKNLSHRVPGFEQLKIKQFPSLSFA